MDQEKIEKLRPFSDGKYKNVDLDHLVMYAMGQLEEMNADLSFENAVVATFKLFPKKFSLSGYPTYPDSDRVMNCLNRCTFKSKQWLGGKSRQGFIITDRSKRIIAESEKLLNEKTVTKAKATSQTRRKENILADVISSAAYSKFNEGQGSAISEAELCYLLQGTLDSARETLRENLRSLKNFAEELKREDILKFLNWLEQHFQIFLCYPQQ